MSTLQGINATNHTWINGLTRGGCVMGGASVVLFRYSSQLSMISMFPVVLPTYCRYSITIWRCALKVFWVWTCILTINAFSIHMQQRLSFSTKHSAITGDNQLKKTHCNAPPILSLNPAICSSFDSYTVTIIWLSLLNFCYMYIQLSNNLISTTTTLKTLKTSFLKKILWWWW